LTVVIDPMDGGYFVNRSVANVTQSPF
jgi:hypothetical protein